VRRDGGPGRRVCVGGGAPPARQGAQPMAEVA
jgi:hypothetical protein